MGSDLDATREAGRRENVLLAMLAAVQFCHVLDFVIIMPLGPQLMRGLHISAGQFGLLVSAYTFAAALSGLVAAVALDRVDRKRGLLWLLTGFAVGTLLCGLAPGQAQRIEYGRFTGAGRAGNRKDAGGG